MDSWGYIKKNLTTVDTLEIIILPTIMCAVRENSIWVYTTFTF